MTFATGLAVTFFGGFATGALTLAEAGAAFLGLVGGFATGDLTLAGAGVVFLGLVGGLATGAGSGAYSSALSSRSSVGAPVASSPLESP